MKHNLHIVHATTYSVYYVKIHATKLPQNSHCSMYSCFVRLLIAVIRSNGLVLATLTCVSATQHSNFKDTGIDETTSSQAIWKLKD